MRDRRHVIITCPLYCEDLAEAEAKNAGLSDIRIRHGALEAEGTLEQAYRLCLWSRIANNVLLPLCQFHVRDKEELLAALAAFPFYEHFSLHDTFAVEGRIVHTFFPNPSIARLVAKDGVADSFRRRFGKRPSVDPGRPDIRLHLNLEGNAGTMSIELSIPGLFKRSYKLRSGEAPLKGNTAAAVLLRAGWKEIAQGGGPLIDLFCGSGTFLFEGLLIAAGIAPGALMPPAGPGKWLGHDRVLWERLVEEAVDQKKAALNGHLPLFFGFDISERAVENATSNLREAGLLPFVRVTRQDFRTVVRTEGGRAEGLVVANPPYGHRLGGGTNLSALYGDLGRILTERFAGYRAAVFAGERALARAVGLRAEKLHTLYNGPLRCTLAHFRLGPPNTYRPPHVEKRNGDVEHRASRRRRL